MGEAEKWQLAVNRFAALHVPLSGESHHQAPDIEVLL